MRKNLVKSMPMQVKAQIHEESKLWSTSQPFSKPIRDARKKSSNQQFRMVVRNFAHHAKPLEAANGFHTPCQISHGMRNLPLCTDSVRFLFSDILCNFLVSPYNQPRYFLLYLFIYLLGRLYIRGRKRGRQICMFFIKHL